MSPLTTVTRQEIEDFLIAEAVLLDERRFDEWLQLFVEDGRYVIPPLDAREASPGDALYLIDEGLKRLRSRVAQLQGRAMWVETPPSRTRHLVSNVRLVSASDEVLRIGASFVVYRIRGAEVLPYVGRYEHTLVAVDGELRFQERKCILDLEELRPHGTLTFIL